MQRSRFSLPHKSYHINFNEIEKVIGSNDKIEYFQKEQDVTMHVKWYLWFVQNRFTLYTKFKTHLASMTITETNWFFDISSIFSKRNSLIKKRCRIDGWFLSIYTYRMSGPERKKNWLLSLSFVLPRHNGNQHELIIVQY